MQIFSTVLILLLIFPKYFASVSPINYETPLQSHKELSLELENDDFSSDAVLTDLVESELLNLQRGLTKTFLSHHSRRKRELLKHYYEAHLDVDHKLETPASYSTVYKNVTLIFSDDWIHALSNDNKYQLSKVTQWASVENGERILNTIEWESKLFILTVSPNNGEYCRLYTLHNKTLVHRQQIRNEGHATSAAFFIHSYGLFLTILVDNSIHSLTISPIYIWSRTYMDQIHEIQTRGASAVDFFHVSHYTYIIYAQSRDSAHNTEVGTLVVRMYGQGDIEKVQLLWSNAPVSVKIVRVFKEIFLILGQSEEGSIVYWFGGYNFIFWQSLESLVGETMSIDSLNLPDGQCLLLASTPSSITIYNFGRNEQTKEGSVFTLASTILTSSPPKIIGSEFMLISNRQELGLGVRVQRGEREVFKIYEMNLVQKALPENELESDEDNLSSCMSHLALRLQHDANAISTLAQTIPSILTTNSDWIYKGTLVAKSITAINEKTEFKVGKIESETGRSSTSYKYPPSVILGEINRSIEELNRAVEEIGVRVLRKSEGGEIDGDLEFLKDLEVNKMDLNSSHLELEYINDVDWMTLERDVLRNDLSHAQIVTGNWKVEAIKSHYVSTPRINNITISDFLLTSTTEQQTLHFSPVFEKDIILKSGLLLHPHAKINSIKFSSIVLSVPSSKVPVSGYKKSNFISGSKNINLSLLNSVNLPHWYNSVLKTDQNERVGGVLKFSKPLDADSLTLKNLNGKNWAEFLNSTLQQGVNQDIYSEFELHKLSVENLETDYVNGAKINDLMTTNSQQLISSTIFVKDLLLKSALTTLHVNGIYLKDAVVKNEKKVRIRSPIKFYKCSFGELTFLEGVKLDGIDVSEAAKLNKTHFYRSKNDEIIFLSGDIIVDNLEAPTFNNTPFENIKDPYWLHNHDNVIESNFDFEHRDVSVSEVFSSDRVRGFKFPDDLISLSSSSDRIFTQLFFKDTVVVNGNVEMSPHIALNGMDLSEIALNIISLNGSSRPISGIKTFENHIKISGNGVIRSINGFDFEKNLVLLNKLETQTISGTKKFYELHAGSAIVATNLEVNGTVNKIKLSEVERGTAFRNDGKIDIYGDVVFKKGFKVDDLKIRENLNEFNVDKLLYNVIPLNKAQKLNISLTLIDGHLNLESSVHLDKINGISFEDYFLNIANVNKPEYFRGKTTFQSIEVEKYLHCDKVNNFNLTYVQETAFSLTRDQTVFAPVSFSNLVTDDIYVDSINGIVIENFVRRDRPAFIYSNIEFESDKVIVDDIQLKGTLNGYKIEEIAEKLETLDGSRVFSSIEIEGDLSWKNSKESYERLSYLFKNAGTLNTQQKIGGKTTFGSLHAKSIDSPKWINGLNLQEILNDAAKRDEPLTFRGKNTFREDVVVSGEVRVENNLDTKEIDGINVRDLFGRIVLKNSKNVITGTKTFSQGLIVKHLEISGKLGDILPSDIITKSDTRRVDSLIFPNELRIGGDLDFRKIPGIKIKNILENRMTLSEDQTISAPISVLDLIVKDCSWSSINSLHLHDLVLNNFNPSSQIITGHKNFSSLTLNFPLDETSLNGNSLAQLKKLAFDKTQDYSIPFPVLFKNRVIFSSSLTLNQELNNFHIPSLAASFTSNLNEFVTKAKVEAELKGNVSVLINSLKNTQERRAVWLDYFEPFAKIQHFYTRVIAFENSDIFEHDETVTLAFHSTKKEEKNNKYCECNNVDLYSFGQYKSENAVKIGEIECGTFYKLGQFSLSSSVPSPNASCANQGSTFIKNEKIGLNWELTGFLNGFPTDAKRFNEGGNEYFVISSCLRGGENEKSGCQIAVFKTRSSDGSFSKIQEIFIQNALEIRLAVERVFGNWVLAIASITSLSHTSPANANCGKWGAVYKWVERDEEFWVLREVEVHNLVDVEIGAAFRDGILYRAFIAFAQGDKVLIYEYDRQRDNYYFIQSIEMDESQVSGISMLSMPEFSYLFIGLMDIGIYAYKYSYAEGFKLDLVVPQNNLYDLSVFIVDNEIYLPFAVSFENDLEEENRGKSSSIIAHAVLQGRLHSTQLTPLYY